MGNKNRHGSCWQNKQDQKCLRKSDTDDITSRI